MPIVECLVCSKERYTKPRDIKRGFGKYCSNSCKFEARKTGKYLDCPSCGLKVYRGLADIKKSKSGLFFCSRSCKATYFNKTNVFGKCREEHPNWVNGGTAYRKYALDVYGLSCFSKEDCPLVNVSLPKFMYEVDHIDNDHSNNDINNLQVLCVWCHREKTYGTR